MLPIPLLALLVAIVLPHPRPPAMLQGNAQTDTAIARIRRDYASVNAMLPRCAKRTQDVFGMSTEGGEMHVYRCGGEIRKIQVTYFGEMGQASREWYLTGGQPFFVYELSTRYMEQFGRVASRTETRVYLRGGQMLRWMEGRRTRSTTGSEASGKTTELNEEPAELLDRARTGRTDAK